MIIKLKLRNLLNNGGLQMRFDSIKIENFRQYKGPVEVKFSLDKEKNFTIIRGTNGAGKTNLLNAITWCLYDEELHKSDTSASGGPKYNLITKNETGPGEEFFIKVELVMLDEYDSKIIFRRQLKYSNDKNNNFIKDPFGSKFDVFYSDGVNDKPLAHPDMFIEKNMPRAIEEYFFFDGEKLEDYFEKNSGSSIGDSVFELSQLNLLESVSSRLVTRKNDYAKQIKGIDTDTGDLVDKINILEAKCRRAKKNKESAENALRKINDDLISLREQLSNVDNKDAKQLEKDLKSLNARKDNLNKKINSKESKLNEFIINKFPNVLIYPAMDYTCELGKDLEEKGFIPPKYKKGFLEDILNKKKCICGCDLSDDLNAYNSILELKNNTSELTNVSEEVNVTLRDLRKIMEKTTKFDKDRKKFHSEVYRDKKELSEVAGEIEDKEFAFSQINHPLIRKLKSDIKDLEHVKETELTKKINAERDIEDAKSTINKLRGKLRTVGINNDKLKLLNKYNSFCEYAIELVEKLKNDFTENIRIKVEKSTEEQFKKLMWKDNFSKVYISKNYDVTLEDVTGEMVSPGILSAGEKLVLALSFVAALNTISGFELPFIIDTPMGRLDQEMKINISKTLPEYVEGNQVALLVTGEEYTDSFREGIIDKVGKEYTIHVNETDKGTESKICLNE